MSIGQILGYINQLLIDWGVMPYISAGMIILTVVGAIVMIRRIWLGS